MAMQLRPRTLAGGFGAFFLVMAFGTWYFTSSLTTPWYGPDLSRWVYMAYLVAGTILLAASGAVAVLRSQFLDRRIIELNEQIEALGGVGSLSLGGDDALPPPLPEEPVRGPVDRDIDHPPPSPSPTATTPGQGPAGGGAAPSSGSGSGPGGCGTRSRGTSQGLRSEGFSSWPSPARCSPAPTACSSPTTTSTRPSSWGSGTPGRAWARTSRRRSTPSSSNDDAVRYCFVTGRGGRASRILMDSTFRQRL